MNHSDLGDSFFEFVPDSSEKLILCFSFSSPKAKAEVHLLPQAVISLAQI